MERTGRSQGCFRAAGLVAERAVLNPAYHFRQALLCLRYSPYAAVVAAATVAIALALSGSSLLLIRSIDSILRSYGADARVTVFLDPASQGESLLPAVEKAAGTGATARFISPDAALGRLRSELGEAGRALNDLAENPLPPSIEVRLSSARLARGDLREVRAVAERLRKIPGVTQVDDAESFIDRLQSALTAIRAIGAVLFAIVLGVALFLVGNVVRLTVFARRDEIDILRLVGATDAFIATPFVIEGTLQGLAGGILAAVLVHTGEISGLPRLAGAFGFAQDILPRPFHWPALLLFVLVGGLLGFVASVFAVVRFLRAAP
jgi:cell division transport system permease protein